MIRQLELPGTIPARPARTGSFRMSLGVLVSLAILLALAAAIHQYHAADVTGIARVTTWTDGTPDISPKIGVVGGFSALPGGDASGGGLFTFRIPVNKSGPQQVSLHLINSEQLAHSYRYINMIVSIIPAVEQDGRLVQDAAAFVQSSGQARDREHQVLNPHKGSVTFVVDTADGMLVDRSSNTVFSPDYTGPHAYAFNVGVSGGSYMAISAGDDLNPTFILDIGD